VLPSVAEGVDVRAGVELGRVAETAAIEHPIVVPHGVEGRIVSIAAAGAMRVDDVVARVESAGGIREITMVQKWRTRVLRPVEERLPFSEPLITGQRVLDTFFPLAGAAACMPWSSF
jgi:V/A-type H+-transporting ATPase subunit A